MRGVASVVRRPLAVSVFVAALLGAGLLPGASALSLARFTDSAVSGGSVASDTLAPPTNLSATGGSSVTLMWTPTVDTYATGYTVYRSAISGGPYSSVGSVTPRTAATTTNNPAAGIWYYVLRSVYQSWTSIDSAQVSATVGSPTTTTIKSCTTTAAETTAAGDNNGYESNPTRVCTDDGSAANDANSGTTFTSASCGSGSTPDTGKDQHRFWGYAFGLPGSVNSIVGITIRADLGMNNNSGTSNLCMQLSWDGGTSWTAIKSMPVSGTGQSAYTFGSTSDTWGRTWAVGDFATTKFRVRVIDASTQSNKTFQLDYVGVTVSYFP